MILELFLRQRDRVLNRAEILDKLWKMDRVVVACVSLEGNIYMYYSFVDFILK